MRPIDLAGKTYGRFLVRGRVPNRQGKVAWACLCSCGTRRVVLGENLRRGRHLSCGCTRIEAATRHGKYRDPLYSTWLNIRQRTTNPKATQFKDYGGRGIKLWAAWDDFGAFHSYIMEHLGPRPEDHQLDRIDNDGDYEPGNLRWATRTQQQHNRRDNVCQRT